MNKIGQIVYNIENYLDNSFKNPKHVGDITNIGEENINNDYYYIIVNKNIETIVKNNHKGITNKGKLYFRKNVDYPRYMIKQFSDLSTTKQLDKCDYIVDNVGITKGYNLYLRVGENEYIQYNEYNFKYRYNIHTLEDLEQYVTLYDKEYYIDSNLSSNDEEDIFVFNNLDKLINVKDLALYTSKNQMLMDEEGFDAISLMLGSNDWDIVNIGFRSLVNFTISYDSNSSGIYIGYLLSKYGDKFSNYNTTVVYKYLKFFFELSVNQRTTNNAIKHLEGIKKYSSDPNQIKFVNKIIDFYKQYGI